VTCRARKETRIDGSLPRVNASKSARSSCMAGVTREATRQAAMQVAGEMLRGERPEALVNLDVWRRLGQR